MKRRQMGMPQTPSKDKNPIMIPCQVARMI